MFIGAGRIVLDFFGNTSVPKKQKALKDLCADLRKNFNVSALEVADFDDPERCVLGFAAVMPENWKELSANSLTQKIAEHIDNTSQARVMVEDLDVLIHGEEWTPQEFDDHREQSDARALIRKKLAKRKG